MKKLIAFSAAILLLTACKKETPAPPGPNEWIVGYWQMTDLEVSGNVTIGGNPLPLTGNGSNYTGGYQLNANKTANYDFSCDVELIIPVLGSFPLPFSQQGNGTWKLENSNKSLIVTDVNGQITTFPIKVLTENIMILEQDTVINMATVTGVINYEVTLEK